MWKFQEEKYQKGGREGERKQRKGGEGKDMRERKRERRRREKVSLASKLAAAGKKEAWGSLDIKKLDRCKNKIQKRTKIINKGKHLVEETQNEI